MTEIIEFSIHEEWSGSDYSGKTCYLPRPIFKELGQLAPEWVVTQTTGNESLFVLGNIHDPKFLAVWDFLKQRGYEPAASGRSGTVLPRNQFMFKIRRIFEEPDLLEAPYLNISLDRTFAEDARRSSNGKIFASKHKKPKLGCAYYNQYFVGSDVVKNELLKQKINVDFREIISSEEPEIVVPGYFEIRSSLQTPPLKAMQIINIKGDSYDGDPSKIWRLYDGFYHDPQLHFEKSEFEKLGSFDLAYTQEHLACKMSVCSNRLFRILRKYDKTLQAIPIRLS